MERETWTLTQKQNHWPTIFPSWTTCWGYDGAEFMGVANQPTFGLMWDPQQKRDPTPYTIWMDKNQRQDSAET